MLIELLYDLFAGISPMYVYLGIVLSIICTFRLMHINLNNSTLRNQEYIKEYHALQFKLMPMCETLGDSRDIHDWITHTTKRMDAPDDDSDCHSFSLTQTRLKRGGQQWSKNLYSLFWENIA
ncbi:hypothetical protein SAMN04488072_11359 [Lentibacillus halodurans]|uniref:Uncharacterized protein n=1 Tax=Lentibacillus halodurans TaxID=237679 RepID=A0A1I0ZSX9_9BACI|nr:hypothetical protein [Lentibacillus halodurans]SFB28879.1 hypothetical protein SAMN04488072_11359 [Lentibacillus halodurans]